MHFVRKVQIVLSNEKVLRSQQLFIQSEMLHNSFKRYFTCKNLPTEPIFTKTNEPNLFRYSKWPFYYSLTL